MNATVTPPVSRNVTIVMTENEAKLLRLVMGKTEYDSVVRAAKGEGDAAWNVVHDLYIALKPDNMACNSQ